MGWFKLLNFCCALLVANMIIGHWCRVFTATSYLVFYDILCCIVWLPITLDTESWMVQNDWCWIFLILSAIVICLNWGVILLALKKNNIDNLAIFSWNFFSAICKFGLLCGALLVVNVIIGIAYILVAPM